LSTSSTRKLAAKGQTIQEPADILRSPLVLEFLGLEERPSYSETDLETAIIDKLQQFLLELGKGFLFESRQRRFTFDSDKYYVDQLSHKSLIHRFRRFHRGKQDWHCFLESVQSV